MIKFGIDPSPTSTALTININNKKFIHHSWYLGEMPKWMYEIKKNIIFNKINSKINSSDYSAIEKNKIIFYDELSLSISNIIKQYLLEENTIEYSISIEGYSYSSSGAHVLDMVSCGTLIRRNLLTICGDLNIISPSSLKQKCARIVYPENKDKKGVYRNNLGISGGSFTKHDILEGAILYLEKYNIESDYLVWCRNNREKLFSINKLSYPITDIIDSFWLSL